MIEVRVLAVKPHPAQATSHPGCWAVQFHASYAEQSRTFWRWHSMYELLDKDSCYITHSNDKEPTHDEIIARFWGDTFGELHGFNFHGT